MYGVCLCARLINSSQFGSVWRCRCHDSNRLSEARDADEIRADRRVHSLPKTDRL